MELPHRNCYWVEPARLMAGEYPGAFELEGAQQRLRRYLSCGVDFFLDLTGPEDGLRPYQSILSGLSPSIEYCRMPIRDMDIPTADFMRQIMEVLRQAVAAERCIYVHCWGGIGRTGTVVGCHLVEQGWSGEAALQRLAELWRGVAKSVIYPRSPQTDRQVEFVRNWVGGK